MTLDVQGGADEAAAFVAAARRGPASVKMMIDAGIAVDAIYKVPAGSRSFGRLDGREKMPGADVERIGHVAMLGRGVIR